jgi:signal recognition particle subunit SRP72
MIICCSFSGLQDSEEHSDILTNLQASQQHLDFINTGSRHAVAALPVSITSSLETGPPPVQQTSILPSARPISVVGDHESPKYSTKKARMRRVPAGVIPGVSAPPDPERWLKKSERSTFNHGKRRRGAGGGATQGMAVDPTPLQAGSTQSSKAGGKGKKKK